MTEIFSTALKGDMEKMYKILGDLCNLMENQNFSAERKEIQELFQFIHNQCKDVTGILQEDIFQWDYLITRYVSEKTVLQEDRNCHG